MRDEDNECRVYMRLARFPRLVQARHNAKTAAGVGGLTLERCRPTCTTAASAHMVWGLPTKTTRSRRTDCCGRPRGSDGSRCVAALGTPGPTSARVETFFHSRDANLKYVQL